MYQLPRELIEEFDRVKVEFKKSLFVDVSRKVDVLFTSLLDKVQLQLSTRQATSVPEGSRSSNQMIRGIDPQIRVPPKSSCPVLGPSSSASTTSTHFFTDGAQVSDGSSL